MDRLPEECLELILSFLDKGQEITALHALLLTNRLLFRLSAAVLYRNPFEWAEKRASVHGQDNHRLPRYSIIVRLLQACANSETSTSDKGTTTIDYLALYSTHSDKHFQHMPIIVSNASVSIKSSGVSNRAIEAAAADADPTTDLEKTLVLPHGIGALAQTAAPMKRLGKYYIQQALVGHTPHHLHTLGFYLHSMGAFESLIGQLSRLCRLELYKRAQKPELSAATRFIQTHRQAHPSALQEIKIEAIAKDRTDLSCLVLAMGQPQVVDVAAWPGAIHFLNQFPLQQCRVLLLRQGIPPPMSVTPIKLLTLGQLQKVRMPALNSQLFTSEAASGEAKGTGISSDGIACGTTVSRDLLNSYQSHPRPSLKSIHFQGRDEDMVPCLRDAADLFRDSVQEMVALSSFGDGVDPVNDAAFHHPNLSLSWVWPLLQLTHLDLEGTVALRFELSALRSCPVLVTLRLNIGRKIPSSWQPAVLAATLADAVPKTVRRLELSGWWAFSDRDLTILLAPVFRRLWRLNLMWCTSPSPHGLMQLLGDLCQGRQQLKWLGLSATASDCVRYQALKTERNLAVELDIQLLTG